MGIQINGNTDNISATDGGLTVSDLEINQSGISTFNNALNIGTGSSIFSPAANTFTLGTNSNERLRIASDGNMGLGTDSLIGNAANVYLTVNGSTLGGIALKANGTTQGYLQGTSSLIRLSSDGAKPITFDTNGGERFRIASSGVATLKNKLIIDDGSNGHLFLNNTSSDNTIHSGTTGFAAYKNLVINAAQHIFKLSNTEKVRITSGGINVTGIVTATDFVSTAGQLSNRNKIQNGAMNVSQRFETDAHTPSSTSRIYTLDRWAYWSNQASKTTIQQVVDAPVGFRFSSKCTVASAYSINSGDWFGYMTHIEGQDLYDLELGNSNAKAFTLSFYVKSSVAGTWAGSIRTKGSSPDHSYPYNYTISSANTWEKKTITIPGPTSGTWVAGRGEGMCVWFDLGSGSAYHATANQWHSANRTGPSASPFIANAGATWQITGVQLEKGSVATEYEHRSAADETSICERYCEVIYGEALDETNEGVMGVGHFYQSSRLIGSYQFHTQKRVGHNGETGDYTIRNTGGYVKGNVSDVQGLNSGASWGNSNQVLFRMNRSACRVDLRGLSGTQGHAGEWRVQGSTKLIFSAEFG